MKKEGEEAKSQSFSCPKCDSFKIMLVNATHKTDALELFLICDNCGYGFSIEFPYINLRLEIPKQSPRKIKNKKKEKIKNAQQT